METYVLQLVKSMFSEVHAGWPRGQLEGFGHRPETPPAPPDEVSNSDLALPLLR